MQSTPKEEADKSMFGQVYGFFKKVGHKIKDAFHSVISWFGWNKFQISCDFFVIKVAAIENQFVWEQVTLTRRVNLQKFWIKTNEAHCHLIINVLQLNRKSWLLFM